MARIYGRIYCVKNLVNAKFYIGQTTRSVAARWREHCAVQGKCRALEAAIRKYGPENFEVRELQTLACAESLNAHEQYWIEALGCLAPRGYNLKGGGGGRGPAHQESKAIMSAAAKTPERMAAFAEMQNRADVRQAMRAARVRDYAGKRDKMMAASHTPEANAKRAQANAAAYREGRRRNSPLSAEARRRINEGNRRAWAAKTAEQRASIAEAIRERWARKVAAGWNRKGQGRKPAP